MTILSKKKQIYKYFCICFRHIVVGPFHKRGQNSEVKIETGSQWILVTLNEVEVYPKFKTDRTSGTYWAGFVSAPCVAVSVRRAVWSVQLTPAGWRRPGVDRGITQMFY